MNCVKLCWTASSCKELLSELVNKLRGSAFDCERKEEELMQEIWAVFSVDVGEEEVAGGG